MRLILIIPVALTVGLLCGCAGTTNSRGTMSNQDLPERLPPIQIMMKGNGAKHWKAIPDEGVWRLM